MKHWLEKSEKKKPEVEQIRAGEQKNYGKEDGRKGNKKMQFEMEEAENACVCVLFLVSSRFQSVPFLTTLFSPLRRTFNPSTPLGRARSLKYSTHH